MCVFPPPVCLSFFSPQLWSFIKCSDDGEFVLYGMLRCLGISVSAVFLLRVQIVRHASGVDAALNDLLFFVCESCLDRHQYVMFDVSIPQCGFTARGRRRVCQLSDDTSEEGWRVAVEG